MDEIVIAPLNDIESALTSLVTSLTNSQSSSGAPLAATKLLSADDELDSSLQRLKRHQTNYARILGLRSEATRYQEEIRKVVQASRQLRVEIGDIHSSILGSDSKDEGLDHKDVDYETLLAFAARIGKHNAEAAQEAELESERRSLAAKPRDTQLDDGDMRVRQEGSTQLVELPEESKNELLMLNNLVAVDRARKGMSIPDAEILRNGALGQLQLIRENEGDDAVDRHVEWMIRAGVQDITSATDEASRPTAAKTEQTQQASPRPSVRPGGVRPPARATMAEEQRKVNLNMWDDDDSD